MAEARHDAGTTSFACPGCGEPLRFTVERVKAPKVEAGPKPSKPKYWNSWNCPSCQRSWSKQELSEHGQASSYPAFITEPETPPDDELLLPKPSRPKPARPAKPAPASPSIFEFPHSYPIEKHSFNIPGLGQQGTHCGSRRLDRFRTDGRSAHYGILRCHRVECPKCWRSWLRLTAFELILALEGYARATRQRPHAAVFSVPPSSIRDWDWEGVNHSLFRRGYRRGRNSAGMEGGYSIFHPYRLDPGWRTAFRMVHHLVVLEDRTGRHPTLRPSWRPVYQAIQDLRRPDRDGNPGSIYPARGRPVPFEEDTVGDWKIVRKLVQLGHGPLHRYVVLGPHTHGIVFGKPSSHSCPDFVIRFLDRRVGDHREPVKLDFDGVVGLVIYLLTHVGILTHLKEYKRHRSRRSIVRRRKTQTIRAWGVLHHSQLEPDLRHRHEKLLRLLGDRAFNQLASEIAERLGLTWDTTEGVPRPCKELEPDWEPLHLLPCYFDRFADELPPALFRFWIEVWEFYKRFQLGPTLEDLPPPPGLHVVAEPPERDVEALAEAPAELRQRLLRPSLYLTRPPRRCRWARGRCADHQAERCPLLGVSACPRAESIDGIIQTESREHARAPASRNLDMRWLPKVDKGE